MSWHQGWKGWLETKTILEKRSLPTRTIGKMAEGSREKWQGSVFDNQTLEANANSFRLIFFAHPTEHVQ